MVFCVRYGGCGWLWLCGCSIKEYFWIARVARSENRACILLLKLAQTTVSRATRVARSAIDAL